MSKQQVKRLLSVDVIRAVTMFFMIFVNDVAGVSGIPSWIGHTAAAEDGMGFSDIIFPAFLFIMGLSLPIAIQSRIDKGNSFISTLSYILLRSGALIVMGFFHVNLENYNPEAILPYPVFLLLATLAFFIIWNDYGPNVTASRKTGLMSGGVAVLIALALLYKGGTSEAPTGMQTHWWGILGLLGWAYLVSSTVYLVFKGNKPAIVIAALVFFFVNILTHSKLIDLGLPVIGDASSISLVMGGVLTAVFYKNNNTVRYRLGLTVLAVAAIAFGFLIRPHAGGISKIYATPAWVFICMGITMVTYAFFTWLIDTKHKAGWFKIIKPAGTSTLTTYLIPYILIGLILLTGFHYPAFLSEGIGGIIRSFLVAFLVIAMAGILERRGIKLKI